MGFADYFMNIFWAQEMQNLSCLVIMILFMLNFIIYLIILKHLLLSLAAGSSQKSPSQAFMISPLISSTKSLINSYFENYGLELRVYFL